MKTIAFLLALCALAPDALAQVTIRDHGGRIVQRTDPLYPGADTWVRRDREGRRLGTVERTPYGDYVVKDRRGNRTRVIDNR